MVKTRLRKAAETVANTGRHLAIAAILSSAALVGVFPVSQAHSNAYLDPPAGMVELCYQTPSLCQPAPETQAPAAMMTRINYINQSVNNRIVARNSKSMLDIGAAGTSNWELVAPGGAGDCKEYALTKLFVLSWLGIPLGAMEIAVVHVPNTSADVSHAILMVRINDQDMVLDNLTDQIVPFSQTKYRLEEVQDPRSSTWVSTK
jgi:predicted transglutaminase-like cysteine proteinase